MLSHFTGSWQPARQHNPVPKRPAEEEQDTGICYQWPGNRRREKKGWGRGVRHREQGHGEEQRHRRPKVGWVGGWVGEVAGGSRRGLVKTHEN